MRKRQLAIAAVSSALSLLACSRSDAPAQPRVIPATHVPPPPAPELPEAATPRGSDPFAPTPGLVVHTAVGNVTLTGGASSPALSPKGDKIAFVRANSLYIEDAMSERETLLVRGTASASPESTIREINSIAFTTDGTRIYFFSRPWTTSNALHTVDAQGGSERFLVDAVSFSVIPGGPHAGEAIANRLRVRPDDSGATFLEPWVVTPGGHMELLSGVNLDGGS